jgi:hypothetical protein
MQELGLSINSAKQQLDTLKVKADALKAARIAKGGEAAQASGEEVPGGLCRVSKVSGGGHTMSQHGIKPVPGLCIQP